MTHHHAEFLTDADIATNRVRCPVHGFIRFSENERAVIDHRLFRRLRYIRQLALTELIYPGASHTRFEHSLGVMELATRAFDALAAKHGDLLEYTFSKVDGLNDRSLAKARQALRLAALLHDVGHSSFSHAAEDVVHKGSGHEELSVKIIRQSELMGGLLTERYDDIVSATQRFARYHLRADGRRQVRLSAARLFTLRGRLRKVRLPAAD
jgi:HD superfamily phosphohydrolase